ncbi:unnamed protein product, partial [Ectocarpus sp. 13 AM-2016]
HTAHRAIDTPRARDGACCGRDGGPNLQHSGGRAGSSGIPPYNRGLRQMGSRWPHCGERWLDGAAVPAALRGQGPLRLHRVLRGVPGRGPHHPGPAAVSRKGCMAVQYGVIGAIRFFRLHNCTLWGAREEVGYGLRCIEGVVE